MDDLAALKKRYTNEFATIVTISGSKYTGQITKINFDPDSIILTHNYQDTSIIGNHIESIAIKTLEKGKK